jgi:hypothetical protein
VRLDVRNATAPGGSFALESILAARPLLELHVTPEDVGLFAGSGLARVPRLYGVAGTASRDPRP